MPRQRKKSIITHSSSHIYIRHPFSLISTFLIDYGHMHSFSEVSLHRNAEVMTMPHVQKADCAFNKIIHFPVDKYQELSTNCVIHWIEIYPMDLKALTIFWTTGATTKAIHYKRLSSYARFIRYGEWKESLSTVRHNNIYLFDSFLLLNELCISMSKLTAHSTVYFVRGTYAKNDWYDTCS